MPSFLEFVNRLTGTRKPDLMNPWTNEPVFLQDNPIEETGNDQTGGATGGAYYPHGYPTPFMEVQRGPGQQKLLHHETLHSLFDKTGALEGLQRSAPNKKLHGIKPADYEHLLINAIMGDTPLHYKTPTEVDYYPTKDLAQGDLNQAILKANQNKEVEQLLMRILGVR